MSYEHGQENLPMDGSSVGRPSTSATHVARTDCHHLAEPEWEVLQQLSTVIGKAAVATILRTLSPTEQHEVALGFVTKEQREVASADAVSRDLVMVQSRTYESFKEELKLAFEPPQNEFRSRAEFLDLQQDPVDEATKVVTFMKGLEEGPMKTYLFREYLSLKQAKLHTNVPRPPRPAAKTECPEPMDLSYTPAVGQQKNKESNVRCFQCGNMGHYAPPSERESHFEVLDDMPNFVILKVKSMTKRVDSLRVLVDSGVSSNFVRQQSLPLLDFEEKHVSRIEELLVLDLDDKFDMVVGMSDVNRIDVARTYTPSSSLLNEVKTAYAHDADAKQLIEFLSAPSDKARRKVAPRLQGSAHRYREHGGLLLYSAVDDNAFRIVMPNDPDLRSRIMSEYHDVPTAGHPGREKTYSLLTRDFYWNHRYKWVRMCVRTCDVCQRVMPAHHSQALLQPLPTPSECWESVSMDYVFGFLRHSRRKIGIVAFVDRFSKMVHLAAVAAEVTSVQTACQFVDMVFKHHGMPNDFGSDRDPRFKARFWQEVFTLLGTQLSMSTADHPQTDGQTERVNRVLVDLLKGYAQSFHNWSDFLPDDRNTADTVLAAAMTRARARARTRQDDVPVPSTDTVKNNEQATPASFKDNVSEKFHAQAGPAAITHNVSAPGTDTTKIHAQSGTDANTNGGSVQGTDADKTNELNPGFSSQAMDFVHERQAVVRFVQDVIAASADRQKLNTDNVGRGNTNEFKIGS
ncbi:reverse transcriptase [Phytophthora megakarya]|uniref:Reverse transcriptase n=1 Tax=Phytophthora megakarya TaxID=4795 RepID=A0A225WIP2_9STRA|nr:reverse transcriptase [Phytophthora megakarya]